MDGADRGAYDHGLVGRPAQGLPPARAIGGQPIDVTKPQFDSGDPATWNLAPPERRVFGLAVHDGRLFYAIADSLQVWSVGLKPGGEFADDAVIELMAPPAAGPTEISRIAFDAQGRMLLADRPAPTGAFDFEALAAPAIGRALRYAIVGTAAGRRVWQEAPDEYALGFPGDYRNGNGGVDAGENYDSNGDLIAGSCGGFVWMSGEELRHAPDAALAAELARSGPLPLSGLQGVGAWQDRPRNAPPVQSYFAELRGWAARRRGARTHGRHRHPAELRSRHACEPRPAGAARGIRAAARRSAGHASSARAAVRFASGRASRRSSAAPAATAARQDSAAASPRLVSAERSEARPVGRVRAYLSTRRRADRPPLLSGRGARGQRCMLQCVVPRRADGDRAEQLLLQFGQRLHGRGRRLGVLRRPGRQRPMPAGRNADLSGRRARDRAMPVSDRLRSGWRRVLPCGQDDVNRGLLSVGRSAGRPEQGRLPAGRAHPGRAALLRLGPRPNGERRVLRAGRRDDRRGLLSEAGRSVQSRFVSRPDQERSGLRDRLRPDGGRNLLQPALCQRRRTRVPDRQAALRAGRAPQSSGRVRSARAASRRSPAARRSGPCRGSAEARRPAGVSRGRGAEPGRPMRAARARPVPERPDPGPGRRLRCDRLAAMPTGRDASPRRLVRNARARALPDGRATHAERRLRADQARALPARNGAQC